MKTFIAFILAVVLVSPAAAQTPRGSLRGTIVDATGARVASAKVALETMDSCRISWGKVTSVEGAELVVERPRLIFGQRKLALSPPESKRVLRQIDGQGFAEAAAPGDFVSIHWNWACEVLPPSALQRLRAATRKYLALANETM